MSIGNEPFYAKFCENGHVMEVGISVERLDDTTHCAECGTSGYVVCPFCESEPFMIDQIDPIAALTDDISPVQYSANDLGSFCTNCGERFPWENDPNTNEFSDLSGLDEELAATGVSELIERGHYQSAVSNAFKVLEIRVRSVGGFDADDVGSSLMKQAFSPESGRLSFGETESEKEGVMFLFSGAFQTLRNPSSHRYIQLDERQARDAVSLVNLLLRLIEENLGDPERND